MLVFAYKATIGAYNFYILVDSAETKVILRTNHDAKDAIRSGDEAIPSSPIFRSEELRRDGVEDTIHNLQTLLLVGVGCGKE